MSNTAGPPNRACGQNRDGAADADRTGAADADRTGAADADRTVPGLDARIHDALSYLHGYVLALDAERARVAARLEAYREGAAAPPEVSELERRHDALTEELDALRTTIDKLREYADPYRQYL